MRLQLPAALLDETFAALRHCGAGRRECQVLWVGPWARPETLTALVHPQHTASAVGFQMDEAWLNRFWLDLAARDLGVRVQIHTHPGAAYHSSIDDAFPLIRTPGFLSLVIPQFAQGAAGFDGAYLTRIEADGSWREQSIPEHLEIV